MCTTLSRLTEDNELTLALKTLGVIDDLASGDAVCETELMPT